MVLRYPVQEEAHEADLQLTEPFPFRPVEGTAATESVEQPEATNADDSMDQGALRKWTGDALRMSNILRDTRPLPRTDELVPELRPMRGKDAKSDEDTESSDDSDSNADEPTHAPLPAAGGQFRPRQ
jgi:hypothetical protein